MTDRDRGFIVRVAFSWGLAVGAICGWITWLVGDFLIWRYPSLFYDHLVQLWPLALVAAPIDWIRLGLVSILVLSVARAWRHCDAWFVQRMLARYNRREAEALVKEISLERDPHRRQQLITLFRVKYPQRPLPDAPWF